jgi:hypothetical protein
MYYAPKGTTYTDYTDTLTISLLLGGLQASILKKSERNRAKAI